MSKNQHVVPHKSGWAVRGEKNEAINHAKEICKNQKSELFIHGEDGKIRERNSYGNDPFPPKG